MGIPSRLAAGVSGVVLLGGAGLAVGAAAPASAAALVAVPPHVTSAHGCGGSRCSSNRHSHRNAHRQHSRQRVIVVNRIHNTARAFSDQLQGQRERQNQNQNREDRGHIATSSAASSSAGGGTGGGGGSSAGGGGGGNHVAQPNELTVVYPEQERAPQAPGTASTPTAKMGAAARTRGPSRTSEPPSPAGGAPAAGPSEGAPRTGVPGSGGSGGAPAEDSGAPGMPGLPGTIVLS
jgi:hypothetical protein